MIRRGKPAVVVLAADEYARMLAGARDRRGSFADHLLGFPGADLPKPDLPRAQAWLDRILPSAPTPRGSGAG